MSAILSAGALALVSAALRHARDAEHLADPGNRRRSPDQAYHLAGFGPECARKATLASRRFDKAIGHRLDGAIDSVIDVAVALDPWALRYEPLDWHARYPNLAQWDPASRYERTGSRNERQVEAVVADARQAVDTMFTALWADGRLPDRYDPW